MNIRIPSSCAILALACSLTQAQPCAPRETAIMVADDGDVADNYGWSVAIEGTTAVVGSLNDDAVGSDSGSVYILSYDGNRWDQTQKLVATGIGSFDGFGDSVAISGDTIVIGSPGDDDAGSGAGAAYVFTNIAGVWTQTTKLVPPTLAGGDNCASEVDIDQDTIILSAMLTDSNGSNSGAAYIYRRIAGTWTYMTQLVPNDNAEFDRFGMDVAVSGSRVLISAPSDDDNGGSSTGSAYIFERDGETWSQTHKLTASDADPDDQFGERLDLSNTTALIGSRYDNAPLGNSGSAYIFEFDGSDWIEQPKLTAPDASSSDYFGQDVAIHNNRAIIGAWGQNDPFGFFNAGAAYAYSKTNGVWSLDNKIVASDQEGSDFFGYAVAVSDDFAIIGADGNDDFWWGPDAGAVYMIEMNCQAQCPADFTNDGVLDFFDISAFLSAYSSADPAADFNGDTNFDFFDISAFLSAFAAGCP